MFHYQSLVILLTSLALITGCSEGLQQRFAADPKLEEQQNSSQGKKQEKSESKQQSTTNTLELNNKVPDSIPFYPNAQLMKQDIDSESGRTEWLALASVDEIKDFYKEKLSDQEWEVVTPFSESSSDKPKMEARSRNSEVTVVVSEASNGNKGSDILVEYQQITSAEADSTETADNDEESTQETAETKQEKSSVESEESVESTTEFDGKFSDLDETPDALKGYVKDMAELGILTPIAMDNGEANGDKKFAPNEPITRATFARWLFQAHNKCYSNRAGEQIRPVSKADPPAFEDISESDPNFPIIQGLAEAGLIPSRLGEQNSQSQFRPNAELTRETLLQWKVPLDTRGPLPSADMEKLKETWNFQDAEKINKDALSAIVADHAHGEHSNLRRVYGYTQLLQPQKPVTRAQAAAALWSFGSDDNVITAEEVLKQNDGNQITSSKEDEMNSKSQ